MLMPCNGMLNNPGTLMLYPVLISFFELCIDVIKHYWPRCY